MRHHGGSPSSSRPEVIVGESRFICPTMKTHVFMGGQGQAKLILKVFSITLDCKKKT